MTNYRIKSLKNVRAEISAQWAAFFILDNHVMRILNASERPGLFPIYSFNGQELCLAKKQSSERLGGFERLSL